MVGRRGDILPYPVLKAVKKLPNNMIVHPHKMAFFLPQLSAIYGVIKNDRTEPMLNMLTMIASLLFSTGSSGRSLSPGKKKAFHAWICCDVLSSMPSYPVVAEATIRMVVRP